MVMLMLYVQGAIFEMEGFNRINIGLLVNSIQNDYSTLVCKGAAIAAEELDVNFLIVPGREINGDWHNIEINRYEYQNNVLYSYITEKNIDVLLVSLGTVAFFLSNDEIQNFMAQYRDMGIKVIAMENEIEGYPSIVFNLEGLREAINHIIKDHGRRKVAFISGPEEHVIADKRLQIYKEVLAENNIVYRPEYVVYGDFTDYCDEKVEELLERNKDDIPEAICCANDSMVIPVKRVCENHGMKIGRDILVTGYDDAAFANVMDPPLTTVKSYIMNMGYQAVCSAVKYYETGTMGREYVKTSLIIRESCGCNPDIVRASETKDIRSDIPKDELVLNIKKYIVKKSSLDVIPQKQINDLIKFIGTVYDRLVAGNGFQPGEISQFVAELISDKNIGYFTIDALNAMIYALKKVALENASDEKKLLIYSSFENMYKAISLHFAEQSHYVENRMIKDRFVFSRIADDMMENGKNEDECFRLMMNDMAHIKVHSCYVFIYHTLFLTDEKIDLNSGEASKLWSRPEYIYLKVFSANKKSIIPPKKYQCIKYDRFFTNKFMPRDRRSTMVMQALYYNEEQYGVMLVETDVNDMAEVMNISKQISTAIKMTRFVNLLEGALESARKANEELVNESVSDQLTGILNRRGFITGSEKCLHSCKNSQYTGAVLYADLDNLKVINDSFGHKEGDFAIKKAADLLKENLRSSDIIGRIGGDEFVAFIMDIDKEQIDAICSRIRKCAADFNEASDKLYNVNISMGVYIFNTKDKETIDQLMSRADKVLYENKKSKSKTSLKIGSGQQK